MWGRGGAGGPAGPGGETTETPGTGSGREGLFPLAEQGCSESWPSLLLDCLSAVGRGGWGEPHTLFPWLRPHQKWMLLAHRSEGWGAPRGSHLHFDGRGLHREGQTGQLEGKGGVGWGRWVWGESPPSTHTHSISGKPQLGRGTFCKLLFREKMIRTVLKTA